MFDEILKLLQEESDARSQKISYHIEQLNLEHERMKHIADQVKHYQNLMQLAQQQAPTAQEVTQQPGVRLGPPVNQ